MTSNRKILMDSEERLRLIEENVRDYAIFTFDTEGSISSWNLGAERILRYSEAEIEGQSISLIFTHEDRKALKPEQEMRIAREMGRAEDERWHLRKDGSRFWASGIMTALRDEEGELRGYAKILRDLTDRKEEKRERRSAFGAEIGIALSRGDTLQHSLQACAEAMVQYLDAAFARVWTLNAEEGMLELQASAGLYTHLDGPHSRIPVGQFKIGLIAEEQKPHRTNAVVGDTRVSDQEWAKRENMVAFAGYPLLVADQVVGVMAMFSREPITEDTLNALALVADTLAQTILRKRVEAEVHILNARLQRLLTETHHRVKNNLQIMSAIIDLQVYNYTDMVPLSELKRISAHIRALSALHDILTQASKENGTVESLPIRPMLEKLLPMLQSTAGSRTIRYAFDEATLTLKRVTSLSLLVNELVSNACKHGKDQVEVRFVNNGAMASLEVEDDGPGFPVEFDSKAAANTGLELVDAFVRHDLGGNVDYTNRAEGGGRVIVRFPLEAVSL